MAVTLAALATVALVSALADDTHSVLRDPLSYFGSVDAPYPLLFNLALGSVGIAIVHWALSRRRRTTTAFLLVSGAAGMMIAALAAVPIDCSPVDDLCEVFIRGRVVSVRHRVHGIIAAVLFSSLAAAMVATAVAALRTRRDRLLVLAAVAAVLLWARIVARPFSEGTAIAELLLVIVPVAAALRHLARADEPDRA